jgi:hypothetical protein
MQKFQIDSVTLVVAALAGALALLLISGPLAWMSSIGGLVLLLILLSFDQEGYRTPFQSLAFAAVCGFSTAVASGIIFQLLANHGEVHLANGQWVTEYVPLTCAFATAIFWAVDRMRMNARKVGPVRVPRALGDTSMFPGAVPGPAEPVRYAPAEAPARVQEVSHSTVEPSPPEVPVAASAEEHDIPTATSFFATAPEPEPHRPLSPGPEPIIPRTGKETTIYVSLLGEGLNVLRSVRAESLGRDFYRILDEMPEGETWQFQPGQVVRCKKKNLSSGKAMVATEEAPRAN